MNFSTPEMYQCCHLVTPIWIFFPRFNVMMALAHDYVIVVAFNNHSIFPSLSVPTPPKKSLTNVYKIITESLLIEWSAFASFEYSI